MTASAPTSWQVTGQTPGSGQTTTGQYVRGYNVSFTTGANNGGSVFIPETMFSPATVKAAIAAKAALLDQVSALTSSS